jgi:hypothetical protein
VATAQLNNLLCPSFGGAETVKDPAVYPALTTGGSAIAAGNYNAIVSSFVVSDAIPASHISGNITGNGASPFPTAAAPDLAKGLGFKSITDGTSKTVIITESLEEVYASWYDGQAAWVVGGWPEAPDTAYEAGASGGPPDGYLGFADPTSPDSRTALNVGKIEGGTQIYYWDAYPGAGTVAQRQWGPSSNHTGGVVVHGFGDGHVTALISTMDGNTYLRLISRNGGEPIPPYE